MEFGVQFFPDVRPEQKSGADYFRDALRLAKNRKRSGSRTSALSSTISSLRRLQPQPMLFLAAAAHRTRRARLVTGAVLPVFNHPLKLAGEIGMLDAISDGRLDVGFARAFLPHEFRRFGRSPDESVARFREGVEQVELLLTCENVTHHGRFHTIENTTSLPRPTQKPRPKFYIARAEYAGFVRLCRRDGLLRHGNPAKRRRDATAARRLSRGLERSRPPGEGEVMLAFHMFCDEDGERARAVASPLLDSYLRSLVEAAADWLDGRASADYPDYDRMIAKMRETTAADQIASGAAWVGSPEEIGAAIAHIREAFGGFEHASLQVNFNLMPFAAAQASMRVFAKRVMPRFAGTDR